MVDLICMDSPIQQILPTVRLKISTPLNVKTKIFEPEIVRKFPLLKQPPQFYIRRLTLGHTSRIAK